MTAEQQAIQKAILNQQVPKFIGLVPLGGNHYHPFAAPIRFPAGVGLAFSGGVSIHTEIAMRCLQELVKTGPEPREAAERSFEYATAFCKLLDERIAEEREKQQAAAKEHAEGNGA